MESHVLVFLCSTSRGQHIHRTWHHLPDCHTRHRSGWNPGSRPVNNQPDGAQRHQISSSLERYVYIVFIAVKSNPMLSCGYRRLLNCTCRAQMRGWIHKCVRRYCMQHNRRSWSWKGIKMEKEGRQKISVMTLTGLIYCAALCWVTVFLYFVLLLPLNSKRTWTHCTHKQVSTQVCHTESINVKEVIAFGWSIRSWCFHYYTGFFLFYVSGFFYTKNLSHL